MSVFNVDFMPAKIRSGFQSLCVYFTDAVTRFTGEPLGMSLIVVFRGETLGKLAGFHLLCRQYF